MRRLVLLLAAATAVAAILATPAGATYGGPELATSQCGGKLVLDVHHGVVNDIDSGEDGNYWAQDAYNRHIRLWQTDTDSYCAIVVYQGTFTTVVGEKTPGSGDDDAVFDSSFTGQYDGGYRATITGTFDPGANPTRGQLGTKDYGCPPGGPRGSCTGLWNWVEAYFPSGYGFAYDWWGWSYSAPGHGTWTNDVGGNAGNITP